MKLPKCQNCEIKDAIKYSKYSSGKFCCKGCSAAYSTKNKRAEINSKVSLKLKGINRGGKFIDKVCLNCKNKFTVKMSKKNQLYCSVICVNTSEIRSKAISDRQILRCSVIEEKVRLREIGRKGGFGTKGYTDNGIYYQSLFEKKVFDLLISKSVKFEPHKLIPNSSKITDVYLSDFNIWIELDGIDREKKKKWIGKDYDYWLEKLELYRREALVLRVFKKYEEVEEFINGSLAQW